MPLLIDIYSTAYDTFEYIIAGVLAGLAIALIILIFKLRKDSALERNIEISHPTDRPTLPTAPPHRSQNDAPAETAGISNDGQPLRKVKLSRNAAVRLACDIRQSLRDTLGKESYANIAGHLDTAAIMTLHRDYPMLTSRQLCHAVYISLGLTPEQTSRAMNIEFGSLKKCRTRLRKRMNLPAGASLEDAFRQYIKD